MSLLLCLLAGAVGLVSAFTAWIFPEVAQAAPTNNVLPKISGTPQQGQTLTLTQGTWTDSTDPTIAITDQWEDCTSPTSCTAISGQTGGSYTLTAADVGFTIEVLETATTANDGSASQSSAATPIVTPPPPVNTALPVITGTAQQGNVLTLTRGTWSDPTAVVTDQWEDCIGIICTPVGVLNATSYILTAVDVGSTIEVVETATNAGGTGLPVSVSTTSSVIALPPVAATPPVITGTAQEGKVLTVKQGTWSNSPTAVTDQWEDCTGATCTPITGHTGTTYTVTASDVGHSIDVLETAANTGGTATARSAQTALIVAPPAEVLAPSISGTPQRGSVLTEHHGTWTGAPTSYGYQWLRCGGLGCTAIAGATGSTYTPAAADVGAQLAVAETATNAGGSSPPANSALTSVVTVAPGVVPVPVSISAPTLSGSPRQGQTLVEAHAVWTNNPASYRYQWMSCSSSGCAAIPGATGGSYTLTASDVGRSIFVIETASNGGGSGAPASSAHTLAVGAASATSLAVSPSGPMTNQLVTLVATVSSSSPNADPAGSLTFYNGNAAISHCVHETFAAASQSATVICQQSFAAGIAGLKAVYTPGPGSLLDASVSTVRALDVGRDPTSTSLAVTRKVTRGSRATYTATVVLPVSNSGPIQPTGSMEFLDGGRPIKGCGQRLLSGLTATCVVAYKSRGTHDISARYSGDSDFGASSSPSRSVQIVKGSSGPIVLGFVSSTLRWRFYYHPHYTNVTMLRAAGLVPGMRVTLACRGAHCPFGSRSIRVRNASSINLLPAFRGRRLRVGSQITLRMTRPHWIGKFYSFTVRAGHGPRIALSCLGVGRTRPGVGC